MEAIKTVKKVKNHQVLIELPDDYEHAEVEVIVLLMNPEDKGKFRKKEEFLAFLRNGPVPDEEEIKKIEAVKQEFQNWTIQEF